MITFFQSLYKTAEPKYISVDDALDRIEKGASLNQVALVRGILDKEKRDAAKCNLPCVCFSGTFRERNSQSLIEHSGFMIIDFDDVGLDYRDILEKSEYTYACWLSPSGNGFKQLIRISHPEHHSAHFISYQKNVFQNADSSGKDVNRVCFESYDPEIYRNPNATVYSKIHKETYVTKATYDNKAVDIRDNFNNLLKWLTNKDGAFVSGQRNIFIYKLASACCRFGFHENDCMHFICSDVLMLDSTFTQKEAERTIRSAYKSNASLAGSAQFDTKYNLVTKKEGIEIDLAGIEDEPTPVKDIIYSDEVKEAALRILMHGYDAADSTGVDAIGFNFRKGDLTILSGVGNYGKTTWLDYLLISKSVKDGDKWCIYTPETFPASEFYHDKTEMLYGGALNGHVNHGVANETYLKYYDWIGKHFFYCYPKDDEHTPEYILERFLEMIIKEKVKGVVIDPFNQMTNDYGGSNNRDDKYLERVLPMFSRFAKENNVYFFVVAHPKVVAKSNGKDFDCPTVFDISGGAMWNNKADNIIIYHRPLGNSNPDDPICEFHKKKIRREKSVGKKGMVLMQFDFPKRRFFIDGIDYLQKLIDKKINHNT